MLLKINPIIPEEKSYKILDLISIPHSNISSIEKEYNQNNGIITINAEYNGDITGGHLKVVYPSVQLDVVYSPMIPPSYYSAEECQTTETVQKILEVVEIMSYAMLFLGVILSCKIVGLEMFGILQLAYFDLAHHDFFNIVLSPLAEFKSFNGINLSFSDQVTALPSNLSSL